MWNVMGLQNDIFNRIVNSYKDPNWVRIRNEYIHSLLDGHIDIAIQTYNHFSFDFKVDYVLWIGHSLKEIPIMECSRTIALDITHGCVQEFLEQSPVLGAIDGRRYATDSAMIY